MRVLFRALAAVAVAGLVLNLSLAQKSLREVPESEHAKLGKDGSRESHQGPDHPSQGNSSSKQGRWGGPDPYGAESFDEFRAKNERELNDPQWQLKIDLQDPKAIVIDYPDGTSQEYWYVLFRVINNNTRSVKSTQLPEPNPEEVDLGRPPEPLEVQGGITNEFEGVPVNCHLDFMLEVYTRDVERDPWDTEWPADPDLIEVPKEVAPNEQALAERRANIKKSYRAISDPYVLQRVAEREELWEWAGNQAGTPQPITLLHPLSDFQRQIGRGHALTAPDLTGPRCLPYRAVVIQGGERAESIRYVAVYGDNTFAGIFGTGDALPDGARLVTSESDAMWGKLTQRRYEAGDCVDRFGRVLRANEPGYLNARIAGGDGQSDHSYGLLQTGHPAIGQGVTMPHFRQYKDGDTVLFDFDTAVTIPGRRNDTFKINGKIVNPADARFGSGTKIDGGTEKFGGSVVGKPVKLLDQRGRALRKYLVTYQAGDVLTQAEWDILRERLGPVTLARYTNTGNIVGRALTADDPVVGLPKIKLGYFVGSDENKQPETIKRGINTGRKGPRGEIILTTEDYTTGRPYDPRNIGPDDFMRDPDGEFTTNRKAPVPDGSALNSGEEYVYAPLGNAGENAVPVPKFDQHGAWEDYLEELSGVKTPLLDAKGEIVRDHLDALLYLKEYEYEYVYMYEYAPVDAEDDGFKGSHGGDRWKLVTERVKMMYKKDAAGRDVEVAPLSRLIHQTRKVTEPEVVDGYETRDAEGKYKFVSLEEYRALNDNKDPGPNVVKVKLVRSIEVDQKVVVGVFADGVRVPAGSKEESWSEAEARAKADGFDVREREVIRYVNKFRDRFVSQGGDVRRGKAVDSSDFEETDVVDNGLPENFQTWRRWTVPPPMVYRDPDSGEWEVITRLADKIGPANRWDGADAPRFITRYVSEMWGVAIFKGVSRDWDWANVQVRGLRGRVAKAGLTSDTDVTEVPNPADIGATKVKKAYFNPGYRGEEWVYRVRYERLGDEFENFRDLIRRQRAFWYRDSDEQIATDK
ncbi:MAG: hypothetical protein KF754_08185 [Planctomycetes bacterium]|nr:hypothetical protein [Planctomycetota bacterium]